MNLEIRMENIQGEYSVVYSKSTMHRALFSALLCKGITKITNITLCDDTVATLNLLKDCNCQIKLYENQVIIDSTNLKKPNKPINCNESGSTLRMAIIICSVIFNEIDFLVHDTLVKRPVDGFKDFVDLTIDGNIISCKLKEITSNVEIDGSISSQYITGLLLIAPVANVKEITITNKIVSRGYINITIDVLKEFGINIEFNDNILTINNEYQTNNYYKNEIDESSMAFFKVLEKLGANIFASDINIETSQPDKKLDQLLEDNIEVIDIDETPDLLPILALYCCFKTRDTKITNTYRTTIKESNRLVNTMNELNKLGADIQISNGDMLIKPIKSFKPNMLVESCFDHRIEMMLAIACFKAKEITIKNSGHNNKSYPEFYETLLQLGAIIQQNNN